MNTLDTTRCPSRQAKSHLPDLFDWASQSELHAHATIQTIVLHAGASTVVAAFIAELAGLNTEVRHG
jgi:hypothetical protein